MISTDIRINCAHDIVCRIAPKQLFVLPDYWYRRVVPDLWRILARAKLIEQYAINTMLFATQLAISSNRSVVDDILRIPLDIDSLTDMRQGLIYSDLGLVLHDLGFRREGDTYLEKSIGLYFRSPTTLPLDFALSPCFRLNRKENWLKRKCYLEQLVRCVPDNLYIKQLQAKTLIDLKELVTAQKVVEELISVHRDWGEFFAGRFVLHSR